MNCMLKVKEMTDGRFSVYIDGFLGTCFMLHLDPLTHFCDWLLSEHPLSLILLCLTFTSIHSTQLNLKKKYQLPDLQKYALVKFKHLN